MTALDAAYLSKIITRTPARPFGLVAAQSGRHAASPLCLFFLFFLIAAESRGEGRECPRLVQRGAARLGHPTARGASECMPHAIGWLTHVIDWDATGPDGQGCRFGCGTGGGINHGERDRGRVEGKEGEAGRSGCELANLGRVNSCSRKPVRVSHALTRTHVDALAVGLGEPAAAASGRRGRRRRG